MFSQMFDGCLMFSRIFHSFPWFFHGLQLFSAVLPWFCHGFAMETAEVPPRHGRRAAAVPGAAAEGGDLHGGGDLRYGFYGEECGGSNDLWMVYMI